MALLTLATLASVIALAAQSAVANANTVPAAGIGYLALAVVVLMCAAAFWTRARSAQGTLHLRWSLIAASALAASIGYVPSFTEVLFHIAPVRLLQTVCFNTGEALSILATVLFFADVARSIAIVDILQVLLFVVLRFNLIYSPSRHDHFTVNHLIVAQFVALFLFIIAMVAHLGAASCAELKFLRTLSLYFVCNLIGCFLSNQVSYTWLHYANCSLFDVPGTALLAGFALYLLYTGHSAPPDARDDATLNPPSLLVRSLMPSFLALVNLMLGLFLLQVSVLLAAVAISASVACYVVRTVLMQAQEMQAKTLLESRNRQLEGLAVRDPLTGIGNRHSLAETYGRLSAAANSKDLSLLLMDIDYFKQANDCHGHLYGDRVLIDLASDLETLAAGVPGSHCARLGGDEFILLLPEVTPQAAVRLAEELCSLFRDPPDDRARRKMTLSMGVASLHTGQHLPLETLISSADEALYRAKRLGRNRVEVQFVQEHRSATDGSASLDLIAELQQVAG
jgi:diguanylate cyclase (GGDEF)-like protein